MNKRIRKKKQTLKVEFLRDGRAKVYFCGKNIKCTDIELHGHVDDTPMITCDIEYYKRGKNGAFVLNEDKTEIVRKKIHIGG